MEKMNYWRLSDEFSVVQAVLLIVDLFPDEFPYVMTWEEHKRPENFSATFSALSHAILGERLPATLRYKAEMLPVFTEEELNHYSLNGMNLTDSSMTYSKDVDWDQSTIKIDDLKKWLFSRGVTTGFFFPEAGGNNCSHYLDTGNKNYAPKLGAAIGAWQAVNANPELTKGKTVKQALLKWLRENADQFGLTKDDGNPNEQGIEEIAKISNWDTKGGAPKTPG